MLDLTDSFYVAYANERVEKVTGAEGRESPEWNKVNPGWITGQANWLIQSGLAASVPNWNEPPCSDSSPDLEHTLYNRRDE